VGRRLSERLGGAAGRGWKERKLSLVATELAAENRKRESARADAGDQAEEAAGGGIATEGEQPEVTRRRTGPECMRPRLLTRARVAAWGAC